MIKINCIICGKVIVNPKIERVTCGGVECTKIYRNNKAEEWKFNNRDRVRAYQMKHYYKEKEGDKND